jgi:hypothetical protein
VRLDVIERLLVASMVSSFHLNTAAQNSKGSADIRHPFAPPLWLSFLSSVAPPATSSTAIKVYCELAVGPQMFLKPKQQIWLLF